MPNDPSSLGLKSLNILVVGASLAGITAARCLRRLGFNVQLCDKVQSWNHKLQNPSALVLWPSGQEIIRHLGLNEALQKFAFFNRPIGYRNEKGAWAIEKPLNCTFWPNYTSSTANLKKCELLHILKEDLYHPNPLPLEISFNKDVCSVEGYEITKSPSSFSSPLTPHTSISSLPPIHVQFKDGTSLDTDLVLAADGSHSTIRSLIAPSSRTGTFRFKERITLQGVLEDIQLENLENYEMFHKGLCFAVIPLSSTSVCWMANFPHSSLSFNEFNFQNKINSLSQSSKNLLLQMYQSFHSPVPYIIEQSFKQEIPISCQFHFTEKRPLFYKCRVGFIGNSCYTYPLTAHQAENMLIEDAWNLSMSLSLLRQKQPANANVKPMIKSMLPTFIYRWLYPHVPQTIPECYHSATANRLIRIEEATRMTHMLENVIFPSNALRNQILHSLPTFLQSRLYLKMMIDSLGGMKAIKNKNALTLPSSLQKNHSFSV